LGSAHRYNFGRRLRNLHKQFEVRLELAASEEQRRNSLATLISLHRQRWEPRGGSDAFPDSAVVAFHEQFTRLALERGWLRLYGLTLNGAPAAALYGLRYRRKFYFYQSGMDPRFQRHSAGLVLMGLAIRAAIEEAAEEFDMLHGDEAYKFHWASQARSLARWQADPPGAWSGIERAVDHARRRAGWLAQHVLPLRVLRSLQAYRRRSEWKAS
jgi:CelD/BcsL family acetyltransferase involved in cellulose biosynthesis